MPEPTKHRMRCPYCGHHTMHWGERAILRDKTRSDVFSCRGCGSAYDAEDVGELAREDLAALEMVRAKAVG